YQSLVSVEEFLGMVGNFVAIAASLHYAQLYVGDIRIALHGSAIVERESTHLVDAQPATVGAAQHSGVEQVTEVVHGSAAGASHRANR
ncbi:MAG TPA: hypothetical protein VFV93_15355, partial [Thermomicrobiales bacterium]|nr:hypothetical protein [Thermomicrobiales bacterium]